MKTVNNPLRLPRLPTIEDIAQCCQELCDRLTAEVQRLIRSILEAQIPLSEPSECSCNRPNHCRIVLTTVIADNAETQLEPTFIFCDCLSTSHAHHQRQLDLIHFNLKDGGERIRQLMALEEGVRWLLVRHRELSKAEIRQEQYWLRQDYARTNMVRELRNLEVLRKDSNAAKIPWSAASDPDYTIGEGVRPLDGNSQADEGPKLLQIDKEDLWIDEDMYEYNIPTFHKSLFKTEATLDDEKKLLGYDEKESSPDTVRDLSLGTLKESSPDTVRELSLDTIRESSADTIKGEPASSSPLTVITTPNSVPPSTTQIHLTRLIPLEEILSRFEAIKHKATTYTHSWALEDRSRSDRIAAIYPQQQPPHQGKCCCTPEHRLYHASLDAAFHPPLQQMHIEALLQAETRKTDMGRALQEKTTTERQVE
ncbi:MAG: hypothetical protein LQ338_007573, partial [Usnochroma carphineum]